MKSLNLWQGCLLLAAVSLAFSQHAAAQFGYGVNSAGDLFRFDVDQPQSVTTIGPVGFVPEGIDFRPSTSMLYAIEVGATTTQLYTININTGAATAVGTGFPTTVAGSYDLSGNQTFGFDFNPTTLQADNSMRIRLTATNNTNMRLNSSTGLVAGVDGNLAFSNGSSPFVDASAYTNNAATMGGPTTLYNLDSRNNALLEQNPPNVGTVATVGQFGVTITDSQRNMGFDIVTDSGGVNHAFAVLRRASAPINGPLGAYLLYDVNLATGQITNGALVGPAATPFDFVGGFAVTQIPEPASWLVAAMAAACFVSRRRTS